MKSGRVALTIQGPLMRYVYSGFVACPSHLHASFFRYTNRCYVYPVLLSLFPGTSTHATTHVDGKTPAVWPGLEFFHLFLVDIKVLASWNDRNVDRLLYLGGGV
jgi:hypothetical protein